MSHSSTSNKHTSAAVVLTANSQETTISGSGTGNVSGPILVAKMSEKVRTVSDSESEINYDMFSTSVTSDGGGASVMNTSQISNASTDSTHIKSANLTRSQNIGGVSLCRELIPRY